MTEDWKTRIAMKGNLYYLIAEAWLQKVLSVVTNMHREIQWSSIAGYNELLLSFAVQLEVVPLSNYTDTMTKVMRTFLSNENTLSLFVRVLMLKTRPYIIQEVSYVIELIDSLFCKCECVIILKDLYCIVLYCIVLYCIVLYCIVNSCILCM